MAADPFAALGLAGNIITLIDFTWKLFAGAHTIYRSHSGTTDENEVLETIAHKVSSLSGAVMVEHAQSEDLRTLATASKRVAGELLIALERVKINGSNSRWRSLKAALKEVWSRTEIDNLEKRLSKLQVQVTAQIQHLMGNQLSEISVAVDGLVQTSHLLRLDMKQLATMDGMMKDILKAIETLQAGDRSRQTSNNPMQDLSSAVSSLGAHFQTMADDQGLLSSIHFPMIQARHGNIEKAHADTFEWIFRDSGPDCANPIGFVEWLEQGNGIFWIHGKPGCGKSTLMKFICGHPHTRNHLGRWAESHSRSLHNQSPGPEEEERLRHEAELIESYHRQQSGGNGPGKVGTAKLATATYFFWNAGSKLQKSQEGLLRSLLFEVLRQCPELVGHVRKTRSKYRGPGGDFMETWSPAAVASWTIEELLFTLQDVITVRISATFCLFIDGLDEYELENKRTYRDLIDTLDRITKFPNVKLCASSRSWTVFLDAFESRCAHSIKLEDLTRNDIRRFVLDKFEEHDQYPRLKIHDAGYGKLVEEVVVRAQGVFLWVYLVVRDLLEGLTFNDSVQTMRQRLDQFPEDLEDFFQHMIESIPALYRRQAARTFLITMAAPEPLFLTLHSFLDDIEVDPEFCLNRPQKPLTASELAFRLERMRRQLDGQTKGLLEVVSDPDTTISYFGFRVDFLHRTVRDFLQSSSKVQSFLMNGQEDASKTWVLLCRGILAEIRYAPFVPSRGVGELEVAVQVDGTPPYLTRRQWSRLHRFLFEFVYFARKALLDANNESTVVAVFKAVESAVKTINAGFDVDNSVTLLGLVCEYGLLELLRQMDYDWSALSDPQPEFRPLMLNALVDFKGDSQRQPEVVEYLLKRGADPNQCWKQVSHFQKYMYAVHETKSVDGGGSHIFRIVAALVAHGADLSANIVSANIVVNDPRSLDARAFIKSYFPPELASRILRSSAVGKTKQRRRAKKRARRGTRRTSEVEMQSSTHRKVFGEG